MSNWFSVGYEEADKMSQPRVRRSNRNFWTKADETATVRFLQREPFNYKRAFVPNARGQKYYTSPMVEPDPFIQAGLQLQSTFAYKILDRRVLEFTDRNGEDQKIGPRIMYFAVGQRDRKSLRAFEAQMLADYNEQLVEDGKESVTLDQYNITNYDIKLSKAQGAAWQYLAVRGGVPKLLTKADLTLVEEGDFSLEDDLAPLPIEELRSILGSVAAAVPETSNTEYSYDTEEVAEPTFFGA